MRFLTGEFADYLDPLGHTSFAVWGSCFVLSEPPLANFLASCKVRVRGLGRINAGRFGVCEVC